MTAVSITAGPDSFRSRTETRLGGRRCVVHRVDAVPGADSLPVTQRILLENLLRHEDGETITAEQIAAFATGGLAGGAIPFRPSRLFLHDTNGVPLLTDLAALREAVAAGGGDPGLVRAHIPAELTVDHSIVTEVAGRPDALRRNLEGDYGSNAERYALLKWGTTLQGFRVVPPGRGIMHQINLERLARVVELRDGVAFPDTCAGTDSHTTMINGLGVLAWGVGGIEAESALLGRPIELAVPRVVGVELTGRLGAGVTATDLVLAITERLRSVGVVGCFVEFCGEAAARLPVGYRATIANMAPEYGATVGYFPGDAAAIEYLALTGRSTDHVGMVEAYCRLQGLWWPSGPVRYDVRVRFDLGDVRPVLAGPARPQDRVPLAEVPASVAAAVGRPPRPDRPPPQDRLPDGSVAIAAITSCTNTSNPHVMVCAGLLARNAVRRGLRSKPWVKTSLAPGSRVVTDYLERAGLDDPLDALGFHCVGYGCMTCIGNSGPLTPQAARAAGNGARLAAVVSGNRNFQGRIHNDVELNYLASPPLVVAYALAGSMRVDLSAEPVGHDPAGRPVRLSEIWPSDEEIDRVVSSTHTPDLYRTAYRDLFEGDERWRAIDAPAGGFFDWPPESSYLTRPPFLRDIDAEPAPPQDLRGGRALLLLGDSVTTDHISPAGRIPEDSVAGRYLTTRGVPASELSSYAARRGNAEVMIRGAFSNRRLRNALAPGRPGGLTRDLGDGGREVTIYAAARSYARNAVPLLVIAGQEYGTGSSRDWAAKATALLGVRAVLARSFERIHRSNLVQMGVLPLEFLPGDGAESLGLDGTERFDVRGLADPARLLRGSVTVRAEHPRGRTVEFRARARLDTPGEVNCFRHGGILPLVYRSLLPTLPDPGTRRDASLGVHRPAAPSVGSNYDETIPSL
jgi:aconitate hydratase